MIKAIRLIPTKGPIVGLEPIVVATDRSVRIGRGDEADYPLPMDLQISTLHLSLTANEEGLLAVDLGSTNGTFVNERRIQKKLLFDGDELRLGQSIWKIQIDSVASVDGFPNQGAFRASAYQVPSHDTSKAPPTNPRTPVASANLAVPPIGFAKDFNEPSTSHAVLELISTASKLTLTTADRITVGRTEAATYHFPDLLMSSCHFEVYFDQGKWIAEDRRSTNGLYCNEQRIERAVLKDGDTLRAGQTSFAVHFLASPKAMPASSPASSKVRRADQHIETNPPAMEGLSSPPTVANRSSPTMLPSQSDSYVPNRKVELPDAALHALNSSTSGPPETIRSSVQHGKRRDPHSSKRGDAMLIQVTGNQHTYALFADKEMILGKAAGVDIRIQGDEGISDRHVSVLFTERNLIVKDLQSGTGTYVDGDRIAQGVIGEGSMLQIGDCKLLFSAQAPDSSESDKDDESSFAPPIVPNRSPSIEAFETAPAIQPMPVREHSEQVIAPKSPESSQAYRQPQDESAMSAPPVTNLDVSPVAQQPYVPLDVEALQAKNLQFEDAIRFQAFRMTSGLKLYRGCYKTFDPIEICRRLLFAAPGYLVDVETIDSWLAQVQQASAKVPDEWLTYASPDDAAWMLPLMGKWSHNSTFLAFSRHDAATVKKSLLQFREGTEDGPLLKSFKPSDLVEFLSNGPADKVSAFFAVFDALFVEVNSAELWGVFARPGFSEVMKPLSITRQSKW